MWQKMKNIYHLAQAVLANLIFKFPAQKLHVIGVTGTDGKTTTASLIYHILKSSGKKTALISTIGAYLGSKTYDTGFHVTNPASFPLQRFIKKIVDSGHDYLVLEVTSHGLDQNRVWGIPFEIAVLTNITHEHLDYHGTFEDYMKTKFKLFQKARNCVLNADEAVFPYFKSNLDPKKIMTYSYKLDSSDYNLDSYKFKTNLTGEFNKLNCLAAIATAKILQVPDKDIKQAILSFTAPQGRMEEVQDKPFRIIIDFAHTPNSFAQILPAVKEKTEGRLIHVFGCAGKRDTTKRPLMGTESAKYADIIILTAEDPRDETVDKISWEITQGFEEGWKKESGIQNLESRINNKTYYIISNRKEAIDFAVSISKKGDTLLLTGKAHEKSINYGQGEEPWDEFKVVKDAIKKN
jgi:UDP-N-acetylmuramoyl-L-alanyl-D-glutamate--2,6-diaminopimelate ligase